MFQRSMIYSNRPSEYSDFSSSNIRAIMYMMIASSMGPGREPLSCLRQSSSMVSIQGKARSSKVICTTLKEAAPKSTEDGRVIT